MNVIESRLHAKTAAGASGRSIGAILVDSGRLSADSAERILRLQKDEGLRFGDAAIKLGLLADDDIRYALASQFDYPYLPAGDKETSRRKARLPATGRVNTVSGRAMRGSWRSRPWCRRSLR